MTRVKEKLISSSTFVEDQSKREQSKFFRDYIPQCSFEHASMKLAQANTTFSPLFEEKSGAIMPSTTSSKREMETA